MSGDTRVRTRYGPFGNKFSPLPEPTRLGSNIPPERCALCLSMPCPLHCTSCTGPGFTSEIIQMRVPYCSEECMKEHQPAHAASCRDLKRFARVCDLFMDIWTTYQAETFHIPVEISPPTEQGYVDATVGETVSDRRAWMGLSYKLKFPDKIVGISAETPYEAQEAVLFDHQSIDV